MANSTLKGALAIHGGNPQFLIEKVIRARIYDSIYWKEQCFALTAESIIDKALDLTYIGGVHTNQRPTEFLSLTLKLLTLQPERAILEEYLKAEEFKYLRALAAFYIRLTFRSIDVYEILGPLLNDYRKLRLRDVSGYHLTYFDEFIDQLLTEERVCDIILPRLTKREALEETEGLKKRKSTLEEALNSDRGSRSPSPIQRRRQTSISPDRLRSRSRSGSPMSYRSRSRSISPDRIAENAVGGSKSRGRGGEGYDIDVDMDGSDADGDGNGERRGRDYFPSRTPSDAYASEGDAGGYRSRTGSVSPDRMGQGEGGRYRSRSRSVSPDRL